MKRNLLYIIFIATVGIVALSSCKKDDIVSQNMLYPALAPANIDQDADTWKPVLITDASVFNVPAPDLVGSPAYTADLNEIKGYQQSLTAGQKDIIKYWSAGAVLRWNEILRELVAKHNVAPYQNLDGTYPAPSSTNPFAYPIFPFSNPPYSARAYAYVSAAQYDALIAAYHFKKQYNNIKAPYANDPAVQALVPKSSLPSYPSEDAVVSGASVEMLKLLFPADVAYIEQKAAEQKLYRIMAGANTRGELDAGESLGRQVADVFTARARTDRAGKAIGTPAYWAQLQGNVPAGQQYWISLESPKRPPMLPLFNKVIPFLFDTLTVVAIRPGPPNPTNSDAYKKELAEVLNYSQHATRENKELVSFWADGIGTYTPPGHWNAIAADEFVKQNYSEVRWARNFALLNMAEMDAAIVCWDTKYFYFNPRPSQMNDAVKTLTGVPNFPSYSSGHSNFSAAAAAVLTYLLPDRGTKFTNMAQQAALSRLYGAIHTRSDIEVGLQTGAKVGAYAVQRAKTDGAANGTNN